MCGRFVLVLTPEEMGSLFGASVGRMMIEPRYNIAPKTKIPVVRTHEGSKELVEMRWGLIPFWAKPGANLPLMINARAETVKEKPAFREAFKRRRCLVPATGYYEWLKVGHGKQPFYITRVDGQPIVFAGLWESAPEGQHGHPSVTIVTTTSNADTSKIHDRMPVILESSVRDNWVNDDIKQAEDLMKTSAVGTLISRPVSTQVNSIKNQGIDLMREYAAAPQQASLFESLNPL